MRLVCPKCGAQYEVDTAAIPENGRDVQCSSCGHTWLQYRDDRRPAPRRSPEPAAATPEATTPPTPEPGSEPGPEPEGVSEQPPKSAAESTPPEPGETPEQEARGVDPEVLSILREEAERESRAREQDRAGGLETQPELGLAEAETQKPAAAEAPDPAEHAATSRRDLLPDIEEIDTTLRSDGDTRRGAGSTHSAGTPALRRQPDPPETGRAPNSFRLGFALALLLFAAAAAIYLMPGRVAQAVPEAAPWIETFVAQVDALRLGLSRLVDGGVSRLAGMIAELRN